MSLFPEEDRPPFDAITNPFEHDPMYHPFFLFYKRMKPEFVKEHIMKDMSLAEVNSQLQRTTSGLIDRMTTIRSGKSRLSADTAGVMLVVPGQVPSVEPLVNYTTATFGLDYDATDRKFFSPNGKSSQPFLLSTVTPLATKTIFDPINKEHWIPALQVITNRREEDYELYTRVLKQNESCKRLVFAKKIG